MKYRYNFQDWSRETSQSSWSHPCRTFWKS